jgi:hypothetical protein
MVLAAICTLLQNLPQIFIWTELLPKLVLVAALIISYEVLILFLEFKINLL